MTDTENYSSTNLGSPAQALIRCRAQLLSLLGSGAMPRPPFSSLLLNHCILRIHLEPTPASYTPSGGLLSTLQS